MNCRIGLLLFLALVLSFPGFAQSHRVVQITEKDALNPAEVSVAINPKNPNNIIGVSLQYGKPGQARVSNCRYVTHDGGMMRLCSIMKALHTTRICRSMAFASNVRSAPLAAFG
jgi:hypothetical protein